MSDQQPSDTPMTFGTAISRAFRKYAEFGGRASVPEFWWFILFTTLVSLAAGAFAGLFPGAAGESVRTGLSTLWTLATLLPTLAVATRRLRDGGHRWTYLFWLLVPIAGLIVLALRFCDPSVVTPRPADAIRI